MSRYNAKVGEWITPTETSGSIQNTSRNIALEVTSNAEADEGLTLSPMQIINFEGIIYVRSAGRKAATFTVVPFKVVAGGGDGGGSTPYTLPTASDSVKGGVMIGQGLKMIGDILSAEKQVNEYVSGNQYKVGDLVVYENKMYKCIANHISTGTFDISKWVYVGKGIPIYSSNVNFVVGDLVIFENNLYMCIQAHTSEASFDTEKFQIIGADIHSLTDVEIKNTIDSF